LPQYGKIKDPDLDRGDFVFVAGSSIQVEEDSGGRGRISVSSQPSNAKIYVNGAFEGSSPLSLSLSPGKYVILAKKSGYSPQKEIVRVRSGRDLELTLLLDSVACSIWIRSDPATAKIYLNSEYYGTTPDTIKGLPSGGYRVVLKKKSYNDYSETVHLSTGQESELNARLRKKSHDMVLIPAGEFQMGSNIGSSDERPIYQVYLERFLIDKYEVTVAQYARCHNSGNCKKPKTGSRFNWGKLGRENHPINGIDWNDANSYCRFVKKRLPSQAEWKKAATWKNGRKYKYPSGKSSISCSDAVMDDGNKYGGSDTDGCGKDRTWTVGRKPQEINGTYDMAGNVWEWVQDWNGSLPSGNQRNPKGPSSGSHRVIRGGGWNLASGFLRGAFRYRHVPSVRRFYLGFRCAASP
ncbi:MAG: SUMF1/EgtB/PvdO family nonheme iron enzyme, partial [Proteobacteria bacterium]|nr:SUMF1/EgtB/PvdO family nonheme iron enzyme [Pseudomonadota bacterium]